MLFQDGTIVQGTECELQPKNLIFSVDFFFLCLNENTFHTVIHTRVLCNAVPAICISMENDHDNSAIRCSSGMASNLPALYFFFLSETLVLRNCFYFLFELYGISSVLSAFRHFMGSIISSWKLSTAKFIFLTYILLLMELGDQGERQTEKMTERKGESDIVYSWPVDGTKMLGNVLHTLPMIHSFKHKQGK